MENRSLASKSSRFPTLTRLFRWLFSWRMVRRVFVVLATLVALVALFYAEEDWRGRREWKRYKNQLEAKGVELNWHAFAPSPVPDDQNFAMTPFLAPLLDFNPKPLLPDQLPFRDTNGYNRATAFASELWSRTDNAYRFWPEGRFTDLQAVLSVLRKESDLTGSGTDVSKRAELAKKVLLEFEKYNPVLEEIHNATKRPQSRFNISYGDKDPWAILLPHLGVLKKLSWTLCLRASAELELGNVDAAFEDVELAFSLARSIQEEPLLISHLVRITILRYAEHIIWEGLAGHRWSEDQLQNFQAQMEKIVVLNDFQLPLRMERAVGNATFDLLRSDRRNFLTFTSDPEDSSALLFRVIPGGWIDQEQISYNRLLDDKVLSGMNLVAGQILPKTIDDGTYFIKNLGRSGPEFVRHHCIIARMILPAIGQAVQKSAYAQTSLDEATLACALERYRLVKGEFPETLTELSPQFIQAMPHDVITGEPLKYHRKQNGEFVLYSVGWNENDDGGKTVILSNGKAIEMTQGDWVWPVYPRE